ncbi:MAG: hypothetical protein CL678_13845 [Bdellovibrionaceae bacterium]|nr:hypothetical protein [Pseudobdellovibrionaceae bacterium]
MYYFLFFFIFNFNKKTQSIVFKIGTTFALLQVWRPRMAQITSTDPGLYLQYRDRLEKIEDEHQKSRDSIEEKQEKEVSRLEDRYEASTREVEEDYKKTIENLRDQYQKRLVEKETQVRDEVKDIKADYESRVGHSQGESADQLKIDLKRVIQSNEQEKKAHEANLDELRENHKKKLTNLSNDYQKNIEEAVETAQDVAQKNFDERLVRNQGQVQQAEKKLINKYRDMSKDLSDRNERVMLDASRAIKETKENFKELSRDDQLARERQYNRYRNEVDSQHEKEVNDLIKSHRLENEFLHDKIGELLSEREFYHKGYSEGRAEAIKEYETDWISKTQNQETAHEMEKERLNAEIDKAEDHFSRVYNDQLIEKEAKFTQVVQDMNTRHRKELTEVEKAHEKEAGAIEARENRTNELHTKRLEDAYSNAEEHIRDSLISQEKAYQEQNTRQRENYVDQIKVLERELNRVKTPVEITEITPGVEDIVRKEIQGQYQEVLDSEFERNRNSEESIRESYSQRLNGVMKDAELTENQIRRDNQVRSFQDRKELTQLIESNAFEHKEKVKNVIHATEKEKESLQKHFTNLLERQKRQFDTIISNQRSESEARIHQMQADMEFETQMNQRKINNKHAESIRNLEKKLELQAEGYETELEHLKEDSAEHLRKVQDENRKRIEFLEKSQAKQVAQMEQQFEERQKSLVQDFEDQLENARRVNARVHRSQS